MEKKQKNMKAKGFFRKNLYYFITGGGLLAAALVITLVLVLGGNPSLPPEPDPGPGPVDQTPVTFIVPVENGTLNKGYSETTLVYSSTLREWAVHMALDFKAPAGSKVLAAYEGTVQSVTDTIIDGMMVVIAHKDGLETVYMSLDKDVLVEEGQKVTTGQPIGTVSASLAEKREGPHLHFAAMLDGEEIDPTSYMPDLADK